MASNISKELKLIASQFVKQYYTLLNKAPNYIHNFYNHDSTFIHGTIEMASQHQTEPAVGRDQIETRMKELKLNDCRAKIEQIDCLETLAGGLVLQVIGELSNNGRPMRRFLQTFVLAPCHKEQVSRKPGEPITDSSAASQTSLSQVNQKPKFYVINSIFRYQDDGPDSEFEDDNINVQVNASTDNISTANNNQSSRLDEHDGVDEMKLKDHSSTIVSNPKQPDQHLQHNSQSSQQQTTGSLPPLNPNSATAGVDATPRHQQAARPPFHCAATSEHLISDNKAGRGTIKSINSPTIDRKMDVLERSTEMKANLVAGDGTGVAEQAKPPSPPASVTAPAGSVVSIQNNQAQVSSTVARSNEPKTWANIISRNAQPAQVQPTIPVPAATTIQQSSQNNSKSILAEQQHQNSQPSQISQPVSQQHHHLPQVTPSQQEQSNHDLQQLHQPNTLQQMQGQMDQGQRNQNMHNNRRRNMIRKPTGNKPPAGRPIKDRPRPPPPTNKPMA